MRKGYVDTPVGQIHYREHGEGPPVLLLHQTAWSSLQFKNVLPTLAARGLRGIAIDTAGYGLSDGFDRPPSIPDYAALLPHVMDGLGLTRASLAAHHTGVSIGACFAARHPERVERLVLHGVPLYNAAERAERLARPHYDQTPQPDGSHLSRRFQLVAKMSPGASLEALHWSVVHLFWTGPTEWYGHHAAFEHDVAPDLKAITAPTLIVSNTGDTLHSVLDRIKGMRPDFAYKVIDGGTYHIVYDDGPAWAGLVADFIAGKAS
jgi:pimeloyl-ACP methyl ester carboxylesterase